MFSALAASAAIALSCAISASCQIQAQGSSSAVPCSAMTIGQNGSLNGFQPLLASDPWRTSVAGAAVDPNSAAMIAQLGRSALHADFGSGIYDGSTMGIPYIVVNGQPNITVKYNAYADESDPGVMPVPASAWVEGFPSTAPGDRHLIAIDSSSCMLYELGNAYVQGDGSWQADVGAIWNLQRNNDRPYLWTSTDAAGLPIFPGLARYDEVAAGAIHHALRFTVQRTRAAFVPPATHFASNSTSTSYLPMGARLRLKSSYDISGFSAQSRIILQALKTYGMIVADNGSNMFLTGAPNDGWNNDDLHTLGKVPASAFEVVNMGTPLTKTTLPAGAAPVFKSLTATSTSVAVGTAVTLNWKITGGSNVTVVSPAAGAVSGSSAVVRPLVTTTYTVTSENHFGATSKTITINVKP